MKAIVGLVILAVSGSAAQPVHREPWQWTLEERIAARTDGSAQRTRVSEMMAARNLRLQPDAVPQNLPRIGDSIEGSRHPELLLPTEIFTIFMRNAYAHDDEVAIAFREHAAGRVAELGLPGELLPALEVEASEFIALQSREEALRSEAILVAGDGGALFAEIRDLQRQQCPLRADIIRRMRERFGREAFDRFLYEIVAPGVSETVDVPADAATLRAQEQGCR